MGDSFFTTKDEKMYDGYVKSLFGGVAIVPGTGNDAGQMVPRALSETVDDAPDFTRMFRELHGRVPVAYAGNVEEPVFDFGALRAGMFAYNSSTEDPQTSKTGRRTTGGSVRTGGVRVDESREDVSIEDDQPARVLGRGDDAGVYYVRGPWWWAVQRANLLSSGFGQKYLVDMDYRDPSTGIARGRDKDKRLKLLEDDTKDVTLASLIRMLTENTVNFGSTSVELNQVFGTEGLGRFDSLYEKLTKLTDLTERLDAGLLVPWTGATPKVSEFSAFSPSTTVTDPGSFSPVEQSVSGIAAPTAPGYGTALAGSASATTLGAIVSPTADIASVVEALSPGEFSDDFLMFGTVFQKEDLVPTAVLPSEEGITIPTPDPITAIAITEEQLKALEELIAITDDPTWTVITISAPEKQSMNSEIATAVSAFQDALDLRYAEEEARIRASLASSRMVMSSHADSALALLAANKQRQLAEFRQNLVVEQAKGNLQAGMAHQELLLKAKEIQTSIEQLKLERYVRITANEISSGQVMIGAFMDAYRSNSEVLLRAAVSSAEYALRATVAQAETKLQLETSKAQIGTQVSIATAENYTKGALQSASNFLQRASAQYEALVRIRLANADAANKTEMQNADAKTRASIANAENVLRAAIALADNVTKVSLQNADAVTRVNVSNAENSTRTAISHAENLLRHATSLMDISARLKLAHEENRLKADGSMREMRLRAELAKIENEFKAAALNFDNRFKVETTNNEMEVRIAASLFESKLKVMQANNARILEELNSRSNIARLITDATFAWMSAMTNNTGALSNIITTGLQQYVHQVQTQRDFELTAENQRWQIAVQRASMMDGLASLKWKSQIQNLSVIQQMLASLGQATGTATTPSSFSNLMQGISIGADAISAVISTAVALA